jgi:uncharacterized protein
MGICCFQSQIKGNVLVEKVNDGYFFGEKAVKIASMLLYDNAVNLFDLKKLEKILSRE